MEPRLIEAKAVALWEMNTVFIKDGSTDEVPAGIHHQFEIPLLQLWGSDIEIIAKSFGIDFDPRRIEKNSDGLVEFKKPLYVDGASWHDSVNRYSRIVVEIHPEWRMIIVSLWDQFNIVNRVEHYGTFTVWREPLREYEPLCEK